MFAFDIATARRRIPLAFTPDPGPFSCLLGFLGVRLHGRDLLVPDGESRGVFFGVALEALESDDSQFDLLVEPVHVPGYALEVGDVGVETAFEEGAVGGEAVGVLEGWDRGFWACGRGGFE